MKKLLASLLFCLFILVAPDSATAFSGLGSGTSEDPYQIATCLQLQEMRDELTASYILTADIECGEDAIDGNNTFEWNQNPEDPEHYFGFDPIGSLNGPEEEDIFLWVCLLLLLAQVFLMSQLKTLLCEVGILVERSLV